jgi:CO/xanthine dehydrogenase Mo-binding subunit
VRVHSRVMATNAPPHGAFRGFGAPQSIFAIERHMDQIARAVNLSPEEIRRRNFFGKGQTTSTGQLIKEDVDFNELLDRAFRESDYHAKRERFAREHSGSAIKRGIGFAAFMHGAGFTGSGEVYLASVVELEATAEGIVRVLAASTEMGQGTNTVFSQIASDALGISYDRIEIAQPDTGAVPNSGPTVASRTSMVVGHLVESAALDLKHKLLESGLLCDQCTEAEFVRACKRYIETRGPLRARSVYEAPPGLFWNDKKYSGDAYGTYAWAVYVAEVAVDTVTFEARVTDFVALQEIGKVIHPVLAAGQIEGGVAQAIGMALYENVVWRDGRMANGQMTNYIMPTAADVPPIRVFFEEHPYPFGPHGAKGIGELPMDGPAPAILNAIENAIGISICETPATPEVLMDAMTEKAAAIA